MMFMFRMLITRGQGVDMGVVDKAMIAISPRKTLKKNYH
jgi:hypothetical protein